MAPKPPLPMARRTRVVEVRRTDGTSAEVTLPHCQCGDMFWRDVPGPEPKTCKHLDEVYANPARYAQHLGAAAVFVASHTVRGKHYRVDLLNCTEHGTGLTSKGLVLCVDMPPALQEAGWRDYEKGLHALAA
jgi:hypothetical protein